MSYHIESISSIQSAEFGKGISFVMELNKRVTSKWNDLYYEFIDDLVLDLAIEIESLHININSIKVKLLREDKIKDICLQLKEGIEVANKGLEEYKQSKEYEIYKTLSMVLLDE